MSNSSLHVAKMRMPSKPQVLGERLKQMAIGLGPDAKMPTVAQLCRSLEVSTTTLNLALRQLESEGIITRRNGVGLFVGPNVRAKTSQTVALVCNPAYFRAASHSPFWDLLIEESERRVGAEHESFSLHFSNSTRKSGAGLQEGLLREIGEGRVRGVLGVGTSESVVEQLGEAVPFVSFGGEGQPHVSLDYGRLIEMGAAELGRQGCRRLGLWLPGFFAEFSDPAQAPAHTEIEIFRAALLSQSLEFDAALVQLGSDNPQQRIMPQEQGYATARAVFEQPQHTWPDGIVVADDMMTQGALVAMQKLGVRVGEDVKIVSHANRGSLALAGREDELTLIEFDPAEMVGAMFEMLEILMDGQTPPAPSVGIAPHLKL